MPRCSKISQTGTPARPRWRSARSIAASTVTSGIWGVLIGSSLSSETPGGLLGAKKAPLAPLSRVPMRREFRLSVPRPRQLQLRGGTLMCAMTLAREPDHKYPGAE